MDTRPPARSLKVFVIGGPRSGTSVLTRAMRIVFDLPGHGESHLIPAIANITHPLRVYMHRFRENPADLLIRVLQTEQIEDMLFRYFRDFYATTYGGQSWVDKTPSDEAVHSIALIHRIFPDARVIVMRRNGIEVVRSVRAKFGLPFVDACRNWESVMSGVELARSRCPRALEIDHRELTHDTEGVARACAEHLGRPELWSELVGFLRQDRQDQLTPDAGDTPTTLDDVAWTDEEKATFRRVCGPAMAAFGYRMTAAEYADEAHGADESHGADDEEDTHLVATRPVRRVRRAAIGSDIEARAVEDAG